MRLEVNRQISESETSPTKKCELKGVSKKILKRKFKQRVQERNSTEICNICCFEEETNLFFANF